MSLDLTSNDSQFNFNMRELSGQKVYEFEEFSLDALHLLLFRGGEQLALTPKVVETLLALVERRGEVLSKDELMDIIWPDSIVEESNLSQNLYLLRKTLGNDKDDKPFIETLRRRGYRFNGEVSASESSKGVLPENNAPELAKSPVAEKQPAFVSPNPRSLRVERHGNVIAVSDWREVEPEPEPVINMQSEPPAPLVGTDLPKRRIYAAAIFCSLLVIGALGLFLFRSQLNSAQATARTDAVFMNLTDGESVNNATISPDGNFFAYNSRDGDKSRIFVQQTGQPGRHEIIEPIGGNIWGMSFTPDSQFIYFVTQDDEQYPATLYRVPIFGGVQTKVSSNATVPSFSPDGNEMVFTRGDSDGSRIIIASSDGSRERTLATYLKSERKAIYGGGAWSPDGKTIAYGVIDLSKPNEGNGTIVGTDAVSGETRLLSNEKWDGFFRMAWTRDSQGLVLTGTKAGEAYSTRRDQVYYLSIPDGTERRLTNDGSRYDYISLGVTDKDEVLAVAFNRLSQIWSMETGASGRDVIQLTTGFADGRGGIAPLSDGRVAYLTRNGDGFSIWTMNSDGSSRKQLTTDPPTIEELRSPPDGSFFVFSAKRDGWSHLYRVRSDGSSLQQLTFGESWELDSSISQDGNWIVYDSRIYIDGAERSSLWKISSNGGEPVKLTDEQCVTPHISPDGSSVSCVSADYKTISIISVETGKTIAAFQTLDNPILNVGARWTPDGKALAYIISSNLVGNILTQPINGEAPRPLTDFQSGDIYNFAFSTDGTRLYMARGYQTKKAVLIKNFR